MPRECDYEDASRHWGLRSNHRLDRSRLAMDDALLLWSCANEVQTLSILKVASLNDYRNDTEVSHNTRTNLFRRDAVRHC